MTFSINTEHNGLNMTLSGQWADIAAYYLADNGEAWIYNHCTRSWSNAGSYDDFVRTFDQRCRGKLFTNTEKSV